MKTMTLKNIPEPLLARVRVQAERNHRSVNQEVIRCLDQAVAPSPMSAAAFLKDIRALRSKMSRKGVTLTEEVLSRRREGLA